MKSADWSCRFKFNSFETLHDNILKYDFPEFVIPITYDTKRIYKMDDDSDIENNILCE